VDVILQNNRPNMALGGFTPKQRLAMAALRFYFHDPCKRGGLQCASFGNERSWLKHKDVACGFLVPSLGLLSGGAAIHIAISADKLWRRNLKFQLFSAD